LDSPGGVVAGLVADPAQTETLTPTVEAADRLAKKATVTHEEVHHESVAMVLNVPAVLEHNALVRLFGSGGIDQGRLSRRRPRGRRDNKRCQDEKDQRRQEAGHQINSVRWCLRL